MFYGAQMFVARREFGRLDEQRDEVKCILRTVTLRKWDLVINRKTAKSLRLAIPPWIIARANETID